MKDVAYFCPACGSPSVDASPLAGGGASCSVCSWAGTREQLLLVPLEHDFSSQEEMVLRFVRQLASIIAAGAGKEIGSMLLKWGFIDEKHVQEQLGAYIKAMAVAAAKSVVETRAALEVARFRKKTKYEN
jgi:hypothetical protein